MALAAVTAMALALTSRPSLARAATMQELQTEVEQSNSSYESATERVERLQVDIASNEQRITELEAELPMQRERAAESIRTLYKMQQGTPGLIDLILSSDSFYDFLSTIQYLDIIQTHNTDELQALVDMDHELDETRDELAHQLEEAETEQAAARMALDQAIAARTALEEQMAATAAAEAAAAQAAIAEAQAAAAASDASGSTADTPSTDDSTFTTESGNTTTVQVPEQPSTDPVDWQSDKDSFVAGWGARIDAYLAGSPLAGYGTTFAEAAWAYGVDPRFSPAISNVESSKGAYCFKPHNAWGWGSASWDSWEEAIWAHTAGLASGYGGHLTYSGAQRYCPGNASFWYSSVLAQMEGI